MDSQKEKIDRERGRRMIREMERKKGESESNYWIGIAVLIMLSSVLLFSDSLVQGKNLQEELAQIEALKTGMWQYCGNCFLYFPALLGKSGLSLQLSYQIYLFSINVITVLSAWFCFGKIFPGAYAGLLGATIYTCSIYRGFLLYAENDSGEAIALAFLPFVLLGIRNLLSEQDQKKAPVYLAIGMSALFQVHILTFALTVLFLLLWMIANGRRNVNSVMWKAVGEAFLFFLLVSGACLYKMFLFAGAGRLVWNPNAGQMIQEKGLQVAQLFMGFYQAGTAYDFGKDGINQAAPVGLGVTLLLILLTFALLIRLAGADFSREERQTGWKLFGFGILGCVLCLSCFPWDNLMMTSKAAAKLISCLQQPWHFLGISLVLFTALGCLVYEMLKQKSRQYAVLYAILIAAISVLTFSYQILALRDQYEAVQIKSADQITAMNLAAVDLTARNIAPASATPFAFILYGIAAVTLILMVHKAVSLEKKEKVS